MMQIKKLVKFIGTALLFIGIIKFNTIFESVYTPYDLKKGNEYIERLITLGGIDDGSCATQAIKARNETRRINLALNAIIEDHKEDKRYLAIAYTKSNMDRLTTSMPLC